MHQTVEKLSIILKKQRTNSEEAGSASQKSALFLLLEMLCDSVPDASSSFGSSSVFQTSVTALSNLTGSSDGIMISKFMGKQT